MNMKTVIKDDMFTSQEMPQIASKPPEVKKKKKRPGIDSLTQPQKERTLPAP